MSTTTSDTVASLTIGQLEELMRRVVREELAQYEEYQRNPYPRLKWADVKAELARAEAAGEVPD
ncbi:MAG TPA: hypothetical protein VNL77_02475 [Roseiflexaceae bacterium]|nr:hypothetical protein [Roseiflexaceae bacterium]